MPNVLVTTPFDEAQIDRLRRVSPRLTVARATPETADYSTADILYGGILPRDRARAPNLKWVQVHMAGVNGLHEHPLYADAAIALTTASGVHAATVAEYAMTALLRWRIAWRAWSSGRAGRLAARRAALAPVRADRRAGRDPRHHRLRQHRRELARIAKAAFAMRVLACKRDPSRRADHGYCPAGTGDPEGRLPDGWFSPAQLTELLAASDVVVMCAPLTRETRHMIGARELGTMKPTTYFINVGAAPASTSRARAGARRPAHRRRGGRRLRAGTAAGRTSAVRSRRSRHPLAARLGLRGELRRGLLHVFAENLRRYLDGTPLLNLVDRAKGY